MPTPVYSINASDNEVWVGGEDLLLFHDGKKDYWRTFGMEVGLPSGKIQDISIDSSHVWVASSNGLTRISRKDKKIDTAGFEYLFSGMPVFQVEHHMDVLWIGAWSGIYLYFKGSPQLKNGLEYGQRYFNHKIDKVTAIAKYEDNIYVVGDLGIVKYNVDTSIWELIFNAAIYGNKMVNDIEVNKNNIFIGTTDGIMRLNEKTGYIREYNFPFLKEVSDIIIIDNYLWVGTKNGLVKFKWKTSL